MNRRRRAAVRLMHPTSGNSNSRKFISKILHSTTPIPLESPVSGTPLSPAPVELVTPMDRYAGLWMLSCCKQMFAVERERPPAYYLQHWGRGNPGLGFLAYAYTNPRISRQYS
jgi:hypothetical protein